MASNIEYDKSPIDQQEPTQAMNDDTDTKSTILCEYGCGRDAVKESCLTCGARSCRRCSIEKITYQKSARCGKCFARFTPLNLLAIAGTKFTWSAEYRNIRLHDIGYEEIKTRESSEYVVGSRSVWSKTTDAWSDEPSEEHIELFTANNDDKTARGLNRLILHVIDLRYGVERDYKVYKHNLRRTYRLYETYRSCVGFFLGRKSSDEIELLSEKERVLLNPFIGDMSADKFLTELALLSVDDRAALSRYVYDTSDGKLLDELASLTEEDKISFRRFGDGTFDKNSLDEIDLFSKDKILFHLFDAQVKRACAYEMRKIFYLRIIHEAIGLENETNAAFAWHDVFKKMRDIACQANAITYNLMRACCQLNAHIVFVKIPQKFVQLKSIAFNKFVDYAMTRDATESDYCAAMRTKENLQRDIVEMQPRMESYDDERVDYYDDTEWVYVDPSDHPMSVEKRASRMIDKEYLLNNEIAKYIRTLKDNGIECLKTDHFKMHMSVFYKSRVGNDDALQ